MSAKYKDLNDVIESVYLDTLDEDSYLSNTKRYIIQRFVRLGMKELSLKGSYPTVKPLRLTVKSNNSIELPVDYIKYLRVSWINEVGDLVPIAVNNSITTANAYLLDHLDQILLDNNSIPLVGSGDTDVDREALRFDYSTAPYLADSHYYDGRLFNNSVNINQKFKGGTEFREDIINDRIQFAGVKLTTVVLEYLYDPFLNVSNMDALEVSTMFAFALEKWVYSELISKKRSVPRYEKLDAKRDVKKALLEAKLASAMPTLDDIIKVTNT